jgi:hypothetical protein
MEQQINHFMIEMNVYVRARDAISAKKAQGMCLITLTCLFSWRCQVCCMQKPMQDVMTVPVLT